jgi:hypothetical protein
VATIIKLLVFITERCGAGVIPINFGGGVISEVPPERLLSEVVTIEKLLSQIASVARKKKIKRRRSSN